VPYIEDYPEACEVYLRDEGEFWVRLFDKEDEFNKKIIQLVCDGAHRHTVCTEKDIDHMRTKFLRPTISQGELVPFILR
jgi:hypothetical protein